MVILGDIFSLVLFGFISLWLPTLGSFLSVIYRYHLAPEEVNTMAKKNGDKDISPIGVLIYRWLVLRLWDTLVCLLPLRRRRDAGDPPVTCKYGTSANRID